MSVIVRPFEDRDLEECLAMARELHAESSMAFLPFDDRKVGNLLLDSIDFPDRYLCLVAEIDGGLQGMFMGQVMTYFFCHEQIASDMWVYMRPAYRGYKAATSFITRFIDWAMEAGVREIMVAPSVGIQTDRTEAWLRRIGFERSGVMTKMRV